MRNSFWDKKIPTLLGLFILFLGIGTTTFLTNKQTFFQIRAGSSEQPQSVRITNLTDTSFSVSYYTIDKISGSLSYGQTQSLGQSALDERDQGVGKINNYRIHNVTVNNLLPLTKYYFTILSGQNTYYNSSKPFEVITGSSISDFPKNSETLKGQIILPNGNFPTEAIVYITAENSQVFSTLVKSNGLYEISLEQMRTGDLSTYYNFNQYSTITMLFNGDLLTSNVVLSKTLINAVPTITLSKDYNFLIEGFPSASPSASLLSFPSLESTSSALLDKKVQILTPEKDQGFTDDQPLFKGTAKPGENVEITIHSDQAIQTQVTTDKNGNWNYRPSEPLTPGTHTITIVARDVSGILRTITQSFVVYASGTQIPNANGSPTPTPTQIPQFSITTSPTPSPVTPTPTEILIETPASSTSATILPPTGNPFIIVFGIVGVVISLIGSLLFFLSRKAFRL